MIQVKPSPLDQLLFSIFTTAMEGGINYWSECYEYHWSDQIEHPDGQSYVVAEAVRDFQAHIVNTVEDDDEQYGKEYIINRKIIARGYGLATSSFRERFFWSSGETPPRVIRADTDWDFDAGDADIIVQLGLFGDVLYG